jgi:membrane associated rhomboid family serine protease
MKKNLSHIINIMFIPILFVFAIWFVKGFEYINETDFRQFGIKAWDLNKITGIFTFPFLHADLNHLINNSYPILILGGIISQVYNTISNKVFLYSFLLSGIILFIIGNPNANVIGASGVVYALASFVLISGFIKKQPRLSILSFFVIFMYGSFFWGMLPMPNQVSWEGHLSGFIAGIIIAFLFRKKGPQPKIYNYELEEELEKNININYIYKEENTSEQRKASSEGFISNYNWMHGNPEGEAGIQIRLNEFKRMFESNGIKVNVVIDHSISGKGQLDPPGLDGIPTVRVAYDGFADTIPHEFAHIYLDLLGLDNPAVKAALIDIKRERGRYGDVKMHVDQHYPDYNGDMYDKELLATAMGLEYLRQEKTAISDAENLLNPTPIVDENPGWFQEIINKIYWGWNEFLEGFSGERNIYNPNIEALTREMFTGNLQSENFIGEFNPVLQESRD